MDVVYSLLEFSRFQIEETLLSYCNSHRGNRVGAAIDYWIDNTNLLIEFEEEHPQSTFRIKYENFLADSQSEVSKLFDFLDLPIPAAFLDQVFSSVHDRGNGDPKILFSRGLRSDTIGRGSGLPFWTISTELLQKMNGTLSKLQYPVVTSDWNRIPNPYIPKPEQASSANARNPDLEYLLNIRLPQRLQTTYKSLPRPQVSCRLILTGENGGEWQLHFDRHLLDFGNRDTDIDCHIWVSTPDFLQIVNGALHPALAFTDGRVTVAGDPDVAIALGKLLFELAAECTMNKL